MKGHIRERSPGHWAIVIDGRDATTGERKRKWYSFTGTKRQAQIRCAELIAELKNGTALDPAKVTLREYLDRWLNHMKTQVSPRSWENYRNIVNVNITPVLGNTQLAKLKADAISKAYADMLDSGRKDGKGGLSPRMVVMVHRLLVPALKQAVEWELLKISPAANVKPPRVEKKPMTVLDIDHTASLIEFARSRPRLYIPTLLGAFCGLRRGEIAALHWRAINLDAAQLAVVSNMEETKTWGCREKPPKSGRERTIALSPTLVEELRRHRIKQAEEMLKFGIRQTDDTYICLNDDGAFWKPSMLTTAMKRMIRSSGLPRIKPTHGLRHGHASHLLTKNVHVKVLQERLGHADIQTTLNVYAHLIKGMQEDAADSIDATLGAAMKRHRRD